MYDGIPKLKYTFLCAGVLLKKKGRDPPGSLKNYLGNSNFPLGNSSESG